MTVWRRFRRDRFAVVALVVLVLLGVAAVLAPLVAPYDITERVRSYRAGPSGDHLFGTDGIGRDVFSRVIFGARVSLTVGLLAAGLSSGLGLLLGGVAALVGGVVDNVIMRVVDVLLSIPYVVLALVSAAVLGRSQGSLILVLGLTGWLPVARLARSSFLAVRQRPYVEAATALGLSPWRVAVRHVLPNAVPPVLVFATMSVGGFILAESALSFLGVGPQDPTPAWGLMVSQARGELANAAHLVLFPGVAIFVVVLAFVLVGDGLRDALDPTLEDGAP